MYGPRRAQASKLEPFKPYLGKNFAIKNLRVRRVGLPAVPRDFLIYEPTSERFLLPT